MSKSACSCSCLVVAHCCTDCFVSPFSRDEITVLHACHLNILFTQVNIMMVTLGRKKRQAVTTFIMLCILSSICICKAQFTPADSYLVDCGSSKSTMVGRRTFSADGASPVKVSTSQDILACTSANGVATASDNVVSILDVDWSDIHQSTCFCFVLRSSTNFFH